MFYFKSRTRPMHERRDHFNEECCLLGTPIHHGLYFHTQTQQVYSQQGFLQLDPQHKHKCLFIRENQTNLKALLQKIVSVAAGEGGQVVGGQHTKCARSGQQLGRWGYVSIFDRKRV